MNKGLHLPHTGEIGLPSTGGFIEAFDGTFPAEFLKTPDLTREHLATTKETLCVRIREFLVEPSSWTKEQVAGMLHGTKTLLTGLEVLRKFPEEVKVDNRSIEDSVGELQFGLKLVMEMLSKGDNDYRFKFEVGNSMLRIQKSLEEWNPHASPRSRTTQATNR